MPPPYKRIVSAILILLALSQITAYAKKVTDTKPPTAPRSLTAVSVGQTSVSLQWTASTDNKKVASYLIYQNSTYIAAVYSTAYTVSGLAPATAYSFFIKAKDTSGNVSAASSTLTVTTAAAPSVQSGSKIVAGYYASWSAYSGYTPADIDASGLTHIHYAFAKIGDDLKIAPGDSSIDPSNFAKLNALKQAYPHLKTLISVGGWSDSGKFSDAALTDVSRAVFSDSVVAFLRQYGFDGVDIDWEYPVSGGLASNIRRSADKANFTLLLQTLREKLDAQEALDGKEYLLTIAGGAGSSYAANTELSLIAKHVDYAIIMTYDIHGIWDGYTDLNAPLYTPSGPTPQYQWSADQAVRAWTAGGFPASKLVLGIPFYGYVYNNVSGGGTGLYQSFSGGASVSYDKILSSYLSNSSYVTYLHNDAKVPWLFNGSTFLSYDDELSIKEKAAYIIENTLAGASVWELSQNRGGQLLGTLVFHLKQA